MRNQRNADLLAFIHHQQTSIASSLAFNTASAARISHWALNVRIRIPAQLITNAIQAHWNQAWNLQSLVKLISRTTHLEVVAWLNAIVHTFASQASDRPRTVTAGPEERVVLFLQILFLPQMHSQRLLFVNRSVMDKCGKERYFLFLCPTTKVFNLDF